MKLRFSLGWDVSFASLVVEGCHWSQDKVKAVEIRLKKPNPCEAPDLILNPRPQPVQSCYKKQDGGLGELFGGSLL